jgi:hypothetical protein
MCEVRQIHSLLASPSCEDWIKLFNSHLDWTKLVQMNRSDDTTQLQQHQLSAMPVSREEVSSATAVDKGFRKLCHFIESGWPAQHDMKDCWKPFYRRRDELTLQDGCVRWNSRVVVPLSLRSQILAVLHDGHPGIVAMKSSAPTCVVAQN